MALQSVAIVRKYNRSVTALQKEAQRAGFLYTTTKPDLVISVGGDGTFFFAERKYPGVPKIMVRESKVCEKCNEGTLTDLLRRYTQGRFKIKKYFKLDVTVKRKNGKNLKAIACNDVILRNKVLTTALRFSVFINKKRVYKEVIGDGLVVFGAEAYFKSITKTSFKKGIGIAFNNTTQFLRKMILRESDLPQIKILREKADLGFDNDPHLYTLQQGDEILVKKSKKVARLIQLKV